MNILVCFALIGWGIFFFMTAMFVFYFLAGLWRMLTAFQRFKKSAPQFSEVLAGLAEREFAKNGEVESVRFIGQFIKLDRARRKSWSYRKMICFILRIENSPDYADLRIIGQKKTYRIPCQTVLPVLTSERDETVLRFPETSKQFIPESLIDDVTGIFFLNTIELKTRGAK